MKIELEIPDSFLERRLIILAGIELVAQKMPHEDFWKVKETRCNLCGQCCMTHPFTPYGVDDEGKCLKLQKCGDKWECAAGFHKPYNCLKDPIDEKECSITYKKVKA